MPTKIIYICNETINLDRKELFMDEIQYYENMAKEEATLKREELNLDLAPESIDRDVNILGADIEKALKQKNGEALDNLHNELVNKAIENANVDEQTKEDAKKFANEEISEEDKKKTLEELKSEYRKSLYNEADLEKQTRQAGCPPEVFDQLKVAREHSKELQKEIKKTRGSVIERATKQVKVAFNYVERRARINLIRGRKFFEDISRKITRSLEAAKIRGKQAFTELGYSINRAAKSYYLVSAAEARVSAVIDRGLGNTFEKAERYTSNVKNGFKNLGRTLIGKQQKIEPVKPGKISAYFKSSVDRNIEYANKFTNAYNNAHKAYIKSQELNKKALNDLGRNTSVLDKRIEKAKAKSQKLNNRIIDNPTKTKENTR